MAPAVTTGHAAPVTTTRKEEEHRGGVCPYCHASIDSGEALAVCAACGAHHHAGCREEHGRCATCGALEKLVAPALSADAAHPPPGSRIVARTKGGRLHYTWQPRWTRRDWIRLLAAGLVCPPIGLLIVPLVVQRVWFAWRGAPTYGVALGEHDVTIRGTFADNAVLPLRTRERAVRREELADVLLTGAGASVLALRVGGETLTLASEEEGLGDPDREWLRARLLAWRERRSS